MELVEIQPIPQYCVCIVGCWQKAELKLVLGGMGGTILADKEGSNFMLNIDLVQMCTLCRARRQLSCVN